jgi:peroxiredoxin Q/BCP
VQKAYGVWKEKTMYGKKVMGTERTTVVIGADGAVERVFPKVKVDGHAAEVIGSL